jgi:hypothetical protein
MMSKINNHKLYINNWKVSLVFRILLVATAMYGVLATVNMMGNRVFESLSYYTIQSNVIVLVFFVFLIIQTWRHRNQTSRPHYPTAKGAVMLCITLTFLGYHFLLSPTLFSMGSISYAVSPANIAVHYIVPILTISDWLLFDPKGSFKKLDPLKWTAIPLAYLVFALVRANFATFTVSQSHYPYFFIDIDQFGVGQVAINLLLISVVYIALGYLVYLIDHGLLRLATLKR